MQDKIIAAIAAYLEKEKWSWRLPLGIHETATEIANSIAPLVEAVESDWRDAPEWAQWLASNNKGLSQWFEDKPIWDDDIQMWCESTENGRYKFAGKLAKVKELKQRP